MEIPSVILQGVTRLWNPLRNVLERNLIKHSLEGLVLSGGLVSIIVVLKVYLKMNFYKKGFVWLSFVSQNLMET